MYGVPEGLDIPLISNQSALESSYQLPLVYGLESNPFKGRSASSSISEACPQLSLDLTVPRGFQNWEESFFAHYDSGTIDEEEDTVVVQPEQPLTRSNLEKLTVINDDEKNDTESSGLSLSSDPVTPMDPVWMPPQVDKDMIIETSPDALLDDPSNPYGNHHPYGDPNAKSYFDLSDDSLPNSQRSKESKKKESKTSKFRRRFSVKHTSGRPNVKDLSTANTDSTRMDSGVEQNPFDIPERKLVPVEVAAEKEKQRRREEQAKKSKAGLFTRIGTILHRDKKPEELDLVDEPESIEKINSERATIINVLKDPTAVAGPVTTTIGVRPSMDVKPEVRPETRGTKSCDEPREVRRARDMKEKKHSSDGRQQPRDPRRGADRDPRAAKHPRAATYPQPTPEHARRKRAEDQSRSKRPPKIDVNKELPPSPGMGSARRKTQRPAFGFDERPMPPPADCPAVPAVRDDLWRAPKPREKPRKRSQTTGEAPVGKALPKTNGRTDAREKVPLLRPEGDEARRQHRQHCATQGRSPRPDEHTEAWMKKHEAQEPIADWNFGPAAQTSEWI